MFLYDSIVFISLLTVIVILMTIDPKINDMVKFTNLNISVLYYTHNRILFRIIIKEPPLTLTYLIWPTYVSSCYLM